MRSWYSGYNTRIEWASPELVGLAAAGVVQGRVLDVGCGHGTESLFLAKVGCSVVGLDRDRSAIQLAGRRRSQLPPGARRRLRFQRFDILRRSLRPFGAFDAVVERLVLNNFEAEAERLAILRKFDAALKPGGILLMRIIGMSVEDRRPSVGARRSLPVGRAIKTFLDRHFEGRSAPLEFVGMVTDGFLADEALVIRPQCLGLLLLRKR